MRFNKKINITFNTKEEYKEFLEALDETGTRYTVLEDK